MPTLAVLDGHNLAYRAFYALPDDLATTAGQVTNSAYGFTSMLIKMLGDHHPETINFLHDLAVLRQYQGHITEALELAREALEAAQGSLPAGHLKIAPLFEAVRVRYVGEETIDRIDPRHLSFFNINSEADVEEAQRLLREVGACRATLDLSGRGADNFRDSISHLGE